jgi:hypothetical protein
VKKRQRRLTGVDQIVLSLSARGLPTVEISAHFAEVYVASPSVPIALRRASLSVLVLTQSGALRRVLVRAHVRELTSGAAEDLNARPSADSTLSALTGEQA